jgi:DNA-binding NtrC family response regulator
MGIFKGSILIVDHDPSARAMLLSRLSRECYYCVAASTGLDALDKSAAYYFDVVILDAAMPGAPVAQLLPRLVARCPETQFIVIEPNMDREAVEESICRGACDWVANPLNMSDIVSRVEASMARKRLNPGKRQPAGSGTGWLNGDEKISRDCPWKYAT